MSATRSANGYSRTKAVISHLKLDGFAGHHFCAAASIICEAGLSEFATISGWRQKANTVTIITRAPMPQEEVERRLDEATASDIEVMNAEWESGTCSRCDGTGRISEAKGGQ